MSELYGARLQMVGEELADAATNLLGLAKILQADLGREIDKKMEMNEHRKYAQINGINPRISE